MPLLWCQLKKNGGIINLKVEVLKHAGNNIINYYELEPAQAYCTSFEPHSNNVFVWPANLYNWLGTWDFKLPRKKIESSCCYCAVTVVASSENLPPNFVFPLLYSKLFIVLALKVVLSIHEKFVNMHIIKLKIWSFVTRVVTEPLAC